MPYEPLLNGNPVGMAWSPSNADYVLGEAGPTITDGAGHVSAPPTIWQPSTPIAASGTAAAAAANAISLAGAANKTTYIMGFALCSGAPGAAVTGVATITGLGVAGGTLNYQFVESATFGGQLIVEFPFPLPASAQNTAITVTIPAITSGAVTTASAYGFQR